MLETSQVTAPQCSESRSRIPGQAEDGICDYVTRQEVRIDQSIAGTHQSNLLLYMTCTAFHWKSWPVIQANVICPNPETTTRGFMWIRLSIHVYASIGIRKQRLYAHYLFLQLRATLSMVSNVISPCSASFIFVTSFPINLSTIPTMCALPDPSGCQIKGYMLP